MEASLSTTSYVSIIDAAPASITCNAIDHNLGKWNELLWDVYPDYVISGGSTLLGGANDNFCLEAIAA
jgi:hypothetical protein